MSSHRSATLILFISVATLACRTVPLPEPYVIDVPSKMTGHQAEVAVIAGILNTPPPADYDPTEELSPEEFDAMIWRGFAGRAHRRSWFPESREGNVILAAVNTRGLYLRASIEIKDREIVISIVESKNLSQSETRIHKRAIKWLRNLEAHIRREIGRMSLLTERSS